VSPATDSAPSSELAGPVFIGGTGRSGTHAMSRLLGKHSAYYYFRREMRFHTDRGGFPDLLSGAITADGFLANMRGKFWRRTGADGKPRGLSDKFTEDAYERALEAFRSEYDRDPHAACRALMHSLLDPLTWEAGRRVWIEQTPPTVAAARTLHAIFPGMKMIHMVRDGRDVACSVIRKDWGPSSVGSAIPWWEDRIRACHAATSGLPQERVLVMHLEDLVDLRRPRMYQRTLNFLGVEDEKPMRRFFRGRMPPEAANLGRWRSELSEPEQEKISRQYRESLERMAKDGVSTAPSLARAGFDDPRPSGARAWLGRATAR
jgi:hypothetical protein